MTVRGLDLLSCLLLVQTMVGLFVALENLVENLVGFLGLVVVAVVSFLFPFLLMLPLNHPFFLEYW